MSNHREEIIECPRCGKLDFVKKDDEKWVCLNCDFSRDLTAISIVADCPFCGSRDFIEKEAGKWECMKCKRSKDMTTNDKQEESNTEGLGVLRFIATIVLALLLLSVVMV